MSFLKLGLHFQYSVSVFHLPVLNTRVADQAFHCFIKDMYLKKLFCKTKEATTKFPWVKTTTKEMSNIFLLLLVLLKVLLGVLKV